MFKGQLAITISQRKMILNTPDSKGEEPSFKWQSLAFRKVCVGLPMFLHFTLDGGQPRVRGRGSLMGASKGLAR